MQRVNCEVKLASDSGTNNTVFKQNVSPAEIAILLAIHGEGSVIKIQPTSMDKTPHADERSRLRTTYGHHVVDRVFPGEFSKLPVTLEDLHLGGEDADEGEGHSQDSADAGTDAEEGTVAKGDAVASEGDEDEDDKILRDRINNAISKAELRVIAAENDVDLTGIEDKMASLQGAIIKSIFPAGE